MGDGGSRGAATDQAGAPGDVGGPHRPGPRWPADVLPVIGWDGLGNQGEPLLPLTAVLRSWRTGSARG
jgi:hypothetical protein